MCETKGKHISKVKELSFFVFTARLLVQRIKWLIWAVSYLSQLLYLSTFHSNYPTSQALMDQQAKLTVKINPTVMLVLEKHKNKNKVLGA